MAGSFSNPFRSHETGGKLASVSTAITRTESWRLQSLILTLENPLGRTRNCSRQIELKESWALAIALSLNNVANGIAAGMLRMNPALTTLFVMVFSVVTLLAGLAVGYQFGKRSVGSLSGVISGLLLVVLGLYEIHI